MQFGDPQLFWLLALAPVLALFLVWAFRARRRALERFASAPLAQRLADSVRPVARRWKATLIVAAVTLAALALTQPRWGFEWREVKHKGVDIFVLLDVSKSMLTEDVRPNRLGQAKYAVQDLLEKLRGDRIGLIAFAGTAFVQCPLTVDYEAFRLTLKDADPHIIPRGRNGDWPGDSDGAESLRRGRRTRPCHRVDHRRRADGGDAVAAADEAAKEGVKIFAIGVGTTEGELIPIREEGKPMEFLKDRDGEVVKSRLDENTLKQLALKTGGIYVHSAAGDFGMDAIYDKGIAQLQRKEFASRLQKQYFERFQWPLGMAFVLLVVESFVSDRRAA